MARSTRSAKLETRTARLKSAVRKKPYFVAVAPGVGLGTAAIRPRAHGLFVQRTEKAATGPRLCRRRRLRGRNGTDVLNFWQAQDRARVLARGGRDADEDGGKPITVAQTIDRYETDLRAAAVTFTTPNVFVCICRCAREQDRCAACRPPGSSGTGVTGC